MKTASIGGGFSFSIWGESEKLNIHFSGDVLSSISNIVFIKAISPVMQIILENDACFNILLKNHRRRSVYYKISEAEIGCPECVHFNHISPPSGDYRIIGYG